MKCGKDDKTNSGNTHRYNSISGVSSLGIVAKVFVYDIVVSEFELELCYYAQFRINTLGKGMNMFIPLWVK